MIKITQSCVNDFIEDALALFPLKACGILAGYEGTILRYFQMDNIDDSEDHYAFDDRREYSRNRDIRREDLERYGVIYSVASSPAEPSADDMALAFDEHELNVVISMVDTESVRAFKILQDQQSGEKVLEEIALTIVRTL